MSPRPPTVEAGIEAGWARPRSRGPSLSLSRWRPLSAVMRLVVLAAAVLAGAVGLALVEGWVYPDLTGGASGGVGTAFLGTTTCADWQGAGVDRRLTTIDALRVAATSPDPENRGATLARADAYAVFQQACSTRLSRPVLLYEIYNRAASFQSVRTAGASSDALGH